jgi:hypothetical protein
VWTIELRPLRSDGLIDGFGCVPLLASIPNNKRDEAQQKADKITKLASKVFKVIGTGLPRGQKVAVILTVEG